MDKRVSETKKTLKNQGENFMNQLCIILVCDHYMYLWELYN